jgi:hypothetical protein
MAQLAGAHEQQRRGMDLSASDDAPSYAPLRSGCQHANLDIIGRNKPLFAVFYAYLVEVSGRSR